MMAMRDVPEWVKTYKPSKTKLGRIRRKPKAETATAAEPKPAPPEKPKHPADVRAVAEAVVLSAVEEMTAALIAAGVGLAEDWRPGELRMDWNHRRRRSLGGVRLSLAMYHYVPLDGQGGGKMREYAQLRHVPDIGDLVSGDWRDAVRCLVAHEVAHCAQRTLRRPQDRMGHGSGWQELYRLLRCGCVNPRVVPVPKDG
jgi:hypothetical protein